MALREYHLGLAMSSDANAATIHCPHAQPVATGPSAEENPLKEGRFNCEVFRDRCVAPGHAPAWADCEGSVAAAGEGGLKCRRYHLKLAAEAPEVHCAHAQEVAAAVRSSVEDVNRSGVDGKSKSCSPNKLLLTPRLTLRCLKGKC